MATNRQSSQVILFLGAGASIAGGVPDTYSFVTEFINHIREPNKKETIKKVVQVLKDWKGSEIDVELLLETLTKLQNKKQEPLLLFYKNRDFILREYSEKEPIIDDLKDFIKSKAIVTEGKIEYLQPLLGFVEEFRPLDIISVNYDICVEQFCNVNKLAYQDGFDVYWNPKTFDIEHADIRLYKLHGSVMWYQSDRGGYIKLPVMTERSKIELITGETAENLMLYPMQKWNYAEPLLELLVEIKHLLESETCKFLIVVGYSFRDDHIRRIVWDAARKNKELHLIFVDPRAYQIYSEKLKYYDEMAKNPSSLNGRVICLPYKFENVLPYLKNYYLKNLREALTGETGQRQKEIKGEKVDWVSLVKLFVGAEHTERVETLSERIDSDELDRDWQLSLELPLKMAVNFFYNNQNEKAKQHLDNLYKLLYRMMVDRIYVNVMRDPPVIEINFNYLRNPLGSSQVAAEPFKKAIKTLSEFCETRTFFSNKFHNDLQIITARLKKLTHYLDQFKEGRIRIEDYITLRESKMMPALDQFKAFYRRFQEGYEQQFRERLISLAMQIEKDILEEIFIE